MFGYNPRYQKTGEIMVGKIFSHTMIKDENGKICKFYEKHDFKEGDEVTFELYSGEACNVKLLNEKVSNDTLLHIRNYINNHPKDKSIDLKKSQFSREHEKTNESEKFKKLETLDSGFYELKQDHANALFIAQIAASIAQIGFAGFFALVWFLDLKIAITPEFGLKFSGFRSLGVVQILGFALSFAIYLIFTFIALKSIGKIAKNSSLSRNFIGVFRDCALFGAVMFGVVWTLFKYVIHDFTMQNYAYLAIYSLAFLLFFYKFNSVFLHLAITTHSPIFRAIMPLLLCAVLVGFLTQKVYAFGILGVAFFVQFIAWWLIKKIGFR